LEKNDHIFSNARIFKLLRNIIRISSRIGIYELV